MENGKWKMENGKWTMRRGQTYSANFTVFTLYTLY